MTIHSSGLPHRWRALGIAGLLAALAACGGDPAGHGPAAQAPDAAPARVSLIPQPARIEPAQGRFVLTAATPLLAEGEQARTVAAQFAALLAKGRGLAPELAADGAGGEGAIRFAIDPARATGAESYRLDVSPQGVDVVAGDAAGLFYGAMTLLQLATLDDADTVALPALRIEDAPRFGWRGFMLDPARHFWSVEQVKQVIDAMALHKLNTLHWHLTDDQGWRIEIKQYPKLTEIGGCRIPAGDGGIDPASGQPRPYCGFYTQDQVREVVAYAAARHISIVPEFDVPGHATAAIAAYPELGTLDTPLVPSSEWGVFPNLFNTEEATFRFLENVIAEMVPLFPGPYFHIGGDEAVKDQWEASARVQQRMRELGAKDEMAMQSLLVARLEKFLAGHGKRLIGWDEILEGPLPAQATVMSWRGGEGALKAAREGHDVVMAPSGDLYLDYLQTSSPQEPPGRPATITLQQVYDFEPVPAELEAERQGHILGLQANLWTEHTRTFERLQHHMFPRLAAVAETGWTPAARKDYRDFLQRLPAQLRRYQRWGIGYALTPFQVDAVARDERATGTATVTLSNPLDYEVRYTTDGGEPQADSALYSAPLPVTLPATVRAAAFFEGRPLAPARDYAYDAASLRVRSDEQLATCPAAGDLLLRLEDDGPADGERAIFNLTIFYPCWLWSEADLDGVASIKVRAGTIPYYFQLAHDEPHRRFEPARSAHGELDILADGCEGERIASVPLPAAPEADGFVELTAALPQGLSGRQDLCLRFTGDTRPRTWVLDRATLQLR
ncbi:beta-hexosaminidase [Pseudoxanthomonas broegbernensis]|uniref:beta-N-acetylhexosaminidase n=1 Tax=Pseudoxanthomonas broegbernensis TaxID=83619 RepID=A0A7V8GKQ4_9GAMM|nr:family 20 glycosylhydrolase [Pseudoxanthomonas broegbernensis]KAF1685185.1 beta-hexosaminidase [Pseudoxanthomonas broegbernensis]MBB6065320.1 hexosaminidase [Pseudoxanthomonas broegbernensis]